MPIFHQHILNEIHLQFHDELKFVVRQKFANWFLAKFEYDSYWLSNFLWTEKNTFLYVKVLIHTIVAHGQTKTFMRGSKNHFKT